ncbi:MAG TPA: PPC domain-containing DNA-binding protein [Candidatus Krumholzibacteria bacterium]|jgi:predicted DNA-binding protein with PD1-like motif|nr:PPC domain-containing DNA-binding protein [Candidatus Krumholzibacteria bacterium]
MRIQETDDRLLISLSRGEDVPASITRALVEREVGHAWIQAIGAIEQVTIGAYDLERREYLREELQGGWEVLSINGNFGWADGEPVLHAHAMLSDLQNHVRGGHLFAAKVHVTLEVVAFTGAARLERGYEDAVGLKTWELPHEA